MSKFICKILGRMLQSKSFRPFAKKCVKLVIKYHLLSSDIKDRLRSKKTSIIILIHSLPEKRKNLDIFHTNIQALSII